MRGVQHTADSQEALSWTLPRDDRRVPTRRVLPMARVHWACTGRFVTTTMSGQVAPANVMSQTVDQGYVLCTFIQWLC